MRQVVKEAKNGSLSRFDAGNLRREHHAIEQLDQE